MKFPCPECRKTLEPDGEWAYCPFCGSLLQHHSTVEAFRWAGTFETLGEASIAADELERHGIPSRIQEQTESKPPYFIRQVQFSLEVAEDRFDDAIKTLIELRKSLEDEERSTKKDVEDEARSSHTASAIFFFVAGMLVGGILLGVLMAVSGLDQ